ncbi:uracil-5-carboxylate decarboxylase [Patellaria atrata CBS 101060]|uniref:Uracil-5-carboxylate decarboxylase n=1 Tax=Patellaria atrata CBS 101060 TaxID=1346257 RepID=A0A9P4S304_9PEZI|nr:uracil-5-carboxylate decarboxylase [Patellaria atrata CBS 101060]
MSVVDIHTHVYPPSYISLLRSRTTVPYIYSSPSSPIHRLIILPSDDDASLPPSLRGRPVGPEYWDISHKLRFMDIHGIDKSVISLANPWLDFLSPREGAKWAREINNEVNEIAEKSQGRLYGFATLPLSAPVEDIVAEIERLKTLSYIRGVVMGTTGLGKGMDDETLDLVFAALERESQLIFLHPHYGLPSSVYGPRATEYGHVLPLALGFPLETTVAVTRMLLSGVWDRFKRLNVLLAHSGGTLPFLAGRIESCVRHDSFLKKTGKIENRRDVWDVLKNNVYLDAVIYSHVGLKAAIGASTSDRIMFGTDHPFFPPLEESETAWPSVNTNYTAIKNSLENSEDETAVLGMNAMRVLNLT